MIVCHKAQCRALGGKTTQTLSKRDSIYQLREFKHTSHFSTANVRFTEPIRSSRLSSAKERQRAERNQLIKSLKESPGKRDAKNFLKHFDTPNKSEPVVTPKVEQAVSDVVGQAHYNAWRLDKTGVNLGNLYEPAKAIQESPVFTQQPLSDQFVPDNVEPLHIALVKLRQPQALDDETLGGIALTLSQMVRLGLNIALVIDCDPDKPPTTLELCRKWEDDVREQEARIVAALEEFNEPGAFVVDQALCHSEVDTEIPSTVQVRGGVEVKNKDLLFPPLQDGIVTVIPPIAYTSELQKRRVHADDVILALTREFAGITTQNIQENEPYEMCEALHKTAKSITDKPILDRIIVLDPLGGIPSENRSDGAHIFINLDAEYRDIEKELRGPSLTGPLLTTETKSKEPHSVLGKSNPFSKFVEEGISPLPSTGPRRLSSPSQSTRHSRNLDIVQQALKLLPPSSSALIITPADAAISSQSQNLDFPSPGVRTRRSKNPLIHNLLTDKPMVSSSLPPPFVSRSALTAEPNPPTFLKKGIPVTMIPDPRTSGPWTPPSPSNPSIELENDPRINFPRLVDLIEDSFRRKLNAKHYLDRIRGRVAGIIVAGNYEGGAICTWETPPNCGPQNPLWVPYLDKFAVLTSSQGSGGVADIVWGALTRSCFPEGLVWRSRASNPVNKWYFERSVGMWNLPGGDWTMFWTTEAVPEEWKAVDELRDARGGKGMQARNEEMTRWEAYVKVCSGVVPSWADGGKPD